MTDDYVAPTQEYGTPIPPIEEPKSSGSKIWLIIVVVLVVLCCCCVGFAALMYYVVGDMLMDMFGFYTFAPGHLISLISLS